MEDISTNVLREIKKNIEDSIIRVSYAAIDCKKGSR